MKSLKHLHDLILTQVTLDWVKGTIQIILSNDYSQQTTSISGEDVTAFEYSRKHPWGPSPCVNEVHIEVGAGFATLKIEMQSGDLLVGTGARFAVSQ